MNKLLTAESAVQNIVRRVGPGKDVATLQADIMRALRRAIPVDAAFFASADPDTLIFTGVSVDEPLRSVSALFMDNELGGADVNQFNRLARSSQHVRSLDAATANSRIDSPRYREIMRPLGLGDELRAALVAGSECWGYLCLHREDGMSGFTAEESAFVARIAPHLGLALRRSMLFSIDEPSARTANAGVVVLTDALDVVACTQEARELMAEFADHREARLGVPIVVLAVAAALKQSECSDSVGIRPSSRVRSRTGQWFEIHASRLQGADQQIAVVIEPAARQSVIRLLLAAYGLSSREQEIAARLLRGESTREISDGLHISANTIQDHLKKIFDKTGVRSRRDLVARLLGGAA